MSVARVAIAAAVAERKICNARANGKQDQSGIRRSAGGPTLAPVPAMAGFKKFEDIIAWQLSHALKLRVDMFLARPDFKRQYKVFDQLSDSVRSAPRNIAEGHMRGFKHKEFVFFLRVARGSLGEVINHLIDACDQKLITQRELTECVSLARRAIKATTRLMQWLESTPDPPPPRYKKEDDNAGADDATGEDDAKGDEPGT